MEGNKTLKKQPVEEVQNFFKIQLYQNNFTKTKTNICMYNFGAIKITPKLLRAHAYFC